MLPLLNQVLKDQKSECEELIKVYSALKEVKEKLRHCFSGRRRRMAGSDCGGLFYERFGCRNEITGAHRRTESPWLFESHRAHRTERQDARAALRWRCFERAAGLC